MPEIGDTENECAGLSRAAVAPVGLFGGCFCALQAPSLQARSPGASKARGAAGQRSCWLRTACLNDALSLSSLSAGCLYKK